MTNPSDDFDYTRNKNWFNSARLGLKIGVLWAPTRLWDCLRIPIVTILSATGLLAVGIVTWALGTVMIIVAGLSGYLKEAAPETVVK